MSGRGLVFADGADKGRRLRQLDRAAADVADAYHRVEGVAAVMDTGGMSRPAVMAHFEPQLRALVAQHVEGSSRRAGVLHSARRALAWTVAGSAQVNPEVMVAAALEVGLTYERAFAVLFWHPDGDQEHPGRLRFTISPRDLDPTLHDAGCEQWQVGRDRSLSNTTTEAVLIGTETWNSVRVTASQITVEPLPLQPNAPYTITLDPLRPPLQTLRMAAALIEHHGSLHPLDEPPSGEVWDLQFPSLETSVRGRVLGVDLGIVAGPWLLAAFLPHVDVYTPGADAPGPFDGIVLNVPGHREANYVSTVRDRLAQGLPLSTRDLDRALALPVSPSHRDAVYRNLQASIQQLASGGVLVVMADTAAGEIHQVGRAASAAALTPIELTADGGHLVQFSYAKPPWSCLDVPPPTGRILAAWRRV